MPTATLALIVAAVESPEKVTYKVNGHKVTLINDWGGFDAQWFVAGNEFGPTHLIHASSYESAYEAWIDECPTIDESELPEAYGVPDSPEITAWKETHPSPNYYERDAWDAWCAAKREEERRILRQWGEDADAGLREHPELIEGYTYQSNASGTGIVDEGHYSWLNKADLSQVEVTFPADDTDE